jgi:alkyl hydroperoxide reductase subunit AhpC
MLTVGDTFPAFALKAVKGGPEGLKLDTAFTEITSATDEGKWKLVFFWPKDFTFVCPTEIVAFGKLAGDFADRDTVVYGVSIDSEFVHLNWRLHHDDLRTLPIPMLADRGRSTARNLPGRSEQHRPLRRGERPVRWPQSGGGPARARCAADR